MNPRYGLIICQLILITELSVNLPSFLSRMEDLQAVLLSYSIGIRLYPLVFSMFCCWWAAIKSHNSKKDICHLETRQTRFRLEYKDKPRFGFSWWHILVIYRQYTQKVKKCFNQINATSITILHIYLGIFHSQKYHLYLNTSNIHQDSE